MLDRPIEQSHDIIVGRARTIVEPYQPMHRPETDYTLQSAPTAWKLTRHGEYQSSPRPARMVELWGFGTPEQVPRQGSAGSPC